MTVTAELMGNAIAWFDRASDVPQTPIRAWRAARNKWLRAQGMGGIMRNGKQSKSIPDWWAAHSEFWFSDKIDQQIFIDKWK